MCWRRLNARWLADIRPPARKLVAARVADCINDKEKRLYFYGLDRLAAECGISRSQAQRHLIALRKLGVVVVVVPATQWSPPTYDMPLRALEALPRVPATDPRHSTGAAPESVRHSAGATPEPARGSTSARQGQHGCAPGAAPMLHKTPESSLDDEEEEKGRGAAGAPDGAAGQLPECVDVGEWTKTLATRTDLDPAALLAAARRHADLGCTREAMSKALQQLQGSRLRLLIPKGYSAAVKTGHKRAKSKHAGIKETWAAELAKKTEEPHGCETKAA